MPVVVHLDAGGDPPRGPHRRGAVRPRMVAAAHGGGHERRGGARGAGVLPRPRVREPRDRLLPPRRRGCAEATGGSRRNRGRRGGAGELNRHGIPPQSAEFVCHTKDVLDVYRRARTTRSPRWWGWTRSRCNCWRTSGPRPRRPSGSRTGWKSTPRQARLVAQRGGGGAECAREATEGPRRGQGRARRVPPPSSGTATAPAPA